LANYKSALEGNIATTFQLEQNDAAAIAALQTKLAQDEQAITVLQSQVTALMNPTPPPPAITSVDFTQLPLGPLSGIAGGIQWNSGQWAVDASGVMTACVSSGGVICRKFGIPTNTTLLTVTAECLTAACNIVFTDSVGETQSFTITAPAQRTVIPMQWSKPSGQVSVSTPTSSSSDLRLLGVSFQ
jgi:hypothetical protein